MPYNYLRECYENTGDNEPYHYYDDEGVGYYYDFVNPRNDNFDEDEESYVGRASSDEYWDGEQWIPNPFEYSPPKYEQLSLELYSIDDLLL